MKTKKKWFAICGDEGYSPYAYVGQVRVLEDHGVITVLNDGGADFHRLLEEEGNYRLDSETQTILFDTRLEAVSALTIKMSEKVHEAARDLKWKFRALVKVQEALYIEDTENDN